jgi:hypothetical protein
MNNLSEQQKFAIHWCFNNAMKFVSTGEWSKDKEIIINGMNINQIIKELLQDRLFV